MSSPEEVAQALSNIFDEWDKAERAIKVAEQINGEIINPAVYELRYGGRRIVEGLRLNLRHDYDHALKKLNDAHFDCCRARHDAIDAATTKISNDLQIAVKKIGPGVVLEHFKDYPKLIRELQAIRRLVANSREDRENRDKIYETIANDNLSKIMDYYEDFQANENLLRSAGRWSRLQIIGGVLGWVVATAVAIYAARK